MRSLVVVVGLLVAVAAAGLTTACSGLKASSDEGDAGGGGVDAAADVAEPLDAGTTSPPDAAVPPPKTHLVFVTTAQVAGDFGAAGDPLAAADTLCETEAKANTLPGTYVAWLSYIDTNGTAFNAGTRIPDVAYQLPGIVADGGAPVLVTASKAELLTTGPRVPMDRTASGAQVDQDENARVTWVWTGTNGSGLADGMSCRAWTSATSFEAGVAGNARRIPQPEPSDWTSLGGRTCNLKRRFYCFQKG